MRCPSSDLRFPSSEPEEGGDGVFVCGSFGFTAQLLPLLLVVLSGWATPLSIPNRVVKPPSADDTWTARSWDSRPLPGLLQKAPKGAFCVTFDLQFF